MAGLSEEEIIKHFTLLCLEEVERGSPDVKICEAYMRRRCRERWARMDSQEREAIFEMVAEGAGGQLQEQDHMPTRHLTVGGRIQSTKITERILT